MRHAYGRRPRVLGRGPGDEDSHLSRARGAVSTIPRLIQKDGISLFHGDRPVALEENCMRYDTVERKRSIYQSIHPRLLSLVESISGESYGMNVGWGPPPKLVD